LINNRQGGRRRGRGGGGGGPPRSNNPGPGNRQDNRQRGNAAQLLEKYKGLARDAQMQGDRVLTETYLQYADHYFRTLNETRVRYEEHRRPRDDYSDEDEGDEHDGAREAADRDGDEPDQDIRRDEPRRDEPRREAQGDRGDGRSDRNGEFRARRPRGRPAEAQEEGESERIALDVLPPAIAQSSENEEAPARAPRARRPRRPRTDDEDVAPAA
jgi:hypothetical protein